MKQDKRHRDLTRLSGGAVGLLALVLSFALLAGEALAQCGGVSGAADEYCETLPGAGGERRGPALRPSGGIPAPTGAALEHAGAGAVLAVSAERKRRAAVAPQPGDDGRSLLPLILGALLIALLLVALARRLREAALTPSGDPTTKPG